MGSGTAKSTAKPSSLERSSLNLAGELHKPVIKNLIKEKHICNFEIIYRE